MLELKRFGRRARSSSVTESTFWHNSIRLCWWSLRDTDTFEVSRLLTPSATPSTTPSTPLCAATSTTPVESSPSTSTATAPPAEADPARQPPTALLTLLPRLLLLLLDLVDHRICYSTVLDLQFKSKSQCQIFSSERKKRGRELTVLPRI